MTEAELHNYKKGALDCMSGVEHVEGKSHAYDAGYSAQYQHEQNMANLTGRRK